MDETRLNLLLDLFPSAQPEVIEQIYEGAQIREFESGSLICKEGEPGESFFVILDGQIDVYRTEDHQRILLNYMTRGECFGELSLILDVPRTADLVAAGVVTALEITRSRFSGLIKDDNAILLTLVRRLLERMLRQEDRRVIQQAALQREPDKGQRVFISYARVDEAFARQLASLLKQHGINAWLDVIELGAGKSWSREIGKALDECVVMLLIMSPDSIASENVEDEWNYYLDKSRVIVPVLHETCNIPYRLHKLQYIDLSARDFEKSLSQLITCLNSHLVSLMK